MKFSFLRWFSVRPEKIPLHVVMVSPFVLQTLGTVTLVGYLSYQSGQKAVEDLAYQLMQEVGDRTDHYLRNYVKTPHLVNRLNADAVRLGELDITNANRLERHFLQQIQAFDAVSRIHFSNVQGGYISTRNDERGLAVAATDDFVKGTLRVHKVNQQGDRTELLVEQQNYDARQRPFYQRAVEAGKPTWTDIYTYVPASRGLGISASYPLYNQANQLQGVLSSDLTLVAINAFLQDLKIGSGDIFIIDRSGQLVATSADELASNSASSTSIDNLSIQQLQVTQSQEPLIRSIVQQLQAKFGHLNHINTAAQLRSTSADQQQFLQVIPFADQYGLDWLIVTVVPESVFMADIHRNARVTALLCGTTLLLSIGLNVLLSRWLTQPISQLNRAARQVAQGNLDTRIQIDRRDELGDLARSFDDMILQLKTAFAGLHVLNQAMTESEKRMTQILETLPVGVSMHRLDGSVTYLNSSGRKLLGMTHIPDATVATLSTTYQLYRRGTTDLYPIDELPMVRSLCGETVRVDDIDVYRNNSRICLEVCSAPVFDHQGQVVAVITAFQDVTQRKAAEKILADYNQALESQVAERTEALQQSEAINRAIRDALPDLVIRMKGDGTYLDIKPPTDFPLANPGLTVPGSKVQNILPPDAAQQRLEAIQRTLQTGEIQVYEFPLLLNQQMHWQEVRIVPLATDEVLVVIRDMTDRRQAEEALRQSEAQNRAILTAIPDLMRLVDREGIYLSSVRSNPEIDLIPAHIDPIGKHLTELLPADEAARQLHAIQQALETGYVLTYEQQLQVDDRLRFEELRIVPCGSDVALLMIRDITARKQAERQLQSSLQREQAIARVIDRMYRKLDLHSIFEATVQELRQVMNGDRLMIYRFNPDWSGYFVAESVASGWKAIMQPQNGAAPPSLSTVEHDRCVVNTWNHANTNLQDNYLQDTYLQNTAGGAYRRGLPYLCVEDIYEAGYSPCYIELLESFQTRSYVTVPIYLGTQLWGLLAVYQNSGPRQWQETEIQIMLQVSQQLGVAVQQAELLAQTQQQAVELLSAKEAAEAASRAKSSFLANMSHELRTPLNAILGFTQLMAHDSHTTPIQRNYLETINRNGEYLLQLINDVLSISKLEAGRTLLQNSSFDLYTLLGALEGLFRLRAETKGLQLICDREATLPQYIHTDERKLRQILTNLLDNAIKFTPSGWVCLKASSAPNAPAIVYPTQVENSAPYPLLFEIVDTGVGIAPEELNTIFEAFVQSEAGQRSQQGTGLGLSISRRFVQMMGGDITAYSQLGQGSTFRFTIAVPLADAKFVELHRGSTHIVNGHTQATSLSATDQTIDHQALIRAGLATMPAEWVNRLNRAAWIANDRVIFQLLDEIPASQASLKEAIVHLVNHFQLDQLIQLTQPSNAI